MTISSWRNSECATDISKLALLGACYRHEQSSNMTVTTHLLNFRFFLRMHKQGISAAFFCMHADALPLVKRLVALDVTATTPSFSENVPPLALAAAIGDKELWGFLSHVSDEGCTKLKVHLKPIVARIVCGACNERARHQCQST